MTTRILDNYLSVQLKGLWIPIGRISNDVVTISRDREKHLMKKYNGYGFNREILRMEIFDWIVLEEKNGQERNKYIFPRSWLETHAETDVAFGLDTQIFVSLDKLEEYKCK